MSAVATQLTKGRQTNAAKKVTRGTKSAAQLPERHSGRAPVRDHRDGAGEGRQSQAQARADR